MFIFSNIMCGLNTTLIVLIIILLMIRKNRCKCPTGGCAKSQVEKKKETYVSKGITLHDMYDTNKYLRQYTQNDPVSHLGKRTNYNSDMRCRTAQLVPEISGVYTAYEEQHKVLKPLLPDPYKY